MHEARDFARREEFAHLFLKATDFEHIRIHPQQFLGINGHLAPPCLMWNNPNGTSWWGRCDSPQCTSFLAEDSGYLTV
jgi:hypothetical protein